MFPFKTGAVALLACCSLNGSANASVVDDIRLAYEPVSTREVGGWGRCDQGSGFTDCVIYQQESIALYWKTCSTPYWPKDRDCKKASPEIYLLGRMGSRVFKVDMRNQEAIMIDLGSGTSNYSAHQLRLIAECKKGVYGPSCVIKDLALINPSWGPAVWLTPGAHYPSLEEMQPFFMMTR